MAAPPKNRLKGEASPYLLQHAGNPVQWWPWCDEAFAEARKQNKAVLLSVGYAACHWCHVMAHESFEDHETAALMNALFINIKVDREERPDVDALYQRALHMMGQNGGWPLTMFLDGNGVPFWGGTYFPGTPKHGMSDFKTVLKRISEVYSESPDAVARNKDALQSALKKTWATGDDGADLTPAVFSESATLALGYMDEEFGGFEGAPKFPNGPLLNFLWRAGVRFGDNNLRLCVLKTLTAICQGGIYDHLGGGFCRYSTDRFWLVPHFEKMLYDNALLLELLAEACKEAGNVLFKARALETVAWLEREMRLPGGAFAASLDADSEGEEGKFYIWTKAEIDTTLKGNSKRFCDAYGVTAEGNWEGKTILHRLHASEDFDARADQDLAPLRKSLLAVRSRRVRPFLDDKVLADWNGLLIAALVQGAGAFAKASWLKRAETAFRFIETELVEKDRLYHSWRAGVLGPRAFIDDYAAMIRAALSLYQATGSGRYLARARAWATEAEARLSAAAGRGFYMSGGGGPASFARPLVIHDQATPAGNAVMIENYSALYRLTEEEEWRKKAERLVRTFAKEARHAPLACCSTFCGFDALVSGGHLFIKAEPASPAARKFFAVINSLSWPGLTVQVSAEAAAFPQAETLKTGEALLCRGTECSLPLKNPDILRAELLKLRVTYRQDG